MIISDIKQLSQMMIPKAELFLEKAKKVRSDIIIFETLRTKERQRVLFNSRKSWTMTSFHLTGNAFDVCFKNGKIFSWGATNEEWKKLIAIGEECGLDNLAPLEYGHFQNTFIPLQSKNMLYEKEITEDYTPMSLTRMKILAKEWNESEAFENGLKVKTKPLTYRDFKDTIVFGRIFLSINK